MEYHHSGHDSSTTAFWVPILEKYAAIKGILT
jgi:hypothetical protein